MHKMKRFSFLLGIIPMIIVMAACSSAQAVERIDGTLTVQEGTVEVTQASETVELAAGEELALTAGDTLVLADGAEATIFLTDGSTVELSDGAELSVAELSITDDAYRVSLDVVAGRVLSRVQTVLGVGDKYDIITPSSTASVRGTVFTVEVLDEANSVILVDEGEVAVEAAGEEVVINPGQQVRVMIGEPLEVEPQEAPEEPPVEEPEETEEPVEEPEETEEPEAVACEESDTQEGFIARMTEEFDVSAGEITALLCEGYTPGEIWLAYETANDDGVEATPEELLEMRGGGQAWGLIWQELGLIGQPEGVGGGPPDWAGGEKGQGGESGPPDGAGEKGKGK